MESQDISLNFSAHQIGFLDQETLSKLIGINSQNPQNFSGSFSASIINAELEAIEVAPIATDLGRESLMFSDPSFLVSENTQLAAEATDPLIGKAGVSTEVILSEAIASATAQLADFVSQPGSLDQMQLAFGENWQAEEGIALIQSLAASIALPKIEILSLAQLGANGAFAQETNTIYLAAEFLSENANNLEAVTAVVLEETGHFLDSQLNQVDSAGDEGAIFAALVQGKEIAPLELLALKTEDDSGTLTLNGQTLQVEHSSDEPGVFTVGDTGDVSIEFLTDSGIYVGEVAIFSLQGMEGLARGSVAFIQEAASRALSNSALGYVVISDGAEGGRFTGELGESDKNAGGYSDAKTFVMNPDEAFAIMFVPNGTVAEVLSNPAIEGNQRPLFSIAAANPGNAVQMGQLVPGSVDGGVFAFEDIRLDQQSDRDYNDMIFKIGGVAGFATPVDELIASDKQWQSTELGQKLRNFAAEELSTATDLGTVTGSQTLNGFVGNDDPTDVYRFTLDTTSNVNITLSGLSADADLLLIQDVDGDGVLGEEVHSQEAEIIELSELEGTESESIDRLLQAGTYFIQVEQYEGDTNYDLSLNITPFTPPADTAPNTIPTARDLGLISGTLPAISEYVGSADTIDYYRFTLDTQSDLELELSSLTGDADVRLIRDTNNNGLVDDDDDEVLDISDALGDEDEYIFAPDLAAGDYFIEVEQFDGEVTYDLLLSTTASTTPPDNAGDSLGEARNLGTLNGTLPTITDAVTVRDRQDFYEFTLTETSTFTLSLSGITTDADVYLIRDTDNDDEIDAGDIIAASTLKAGDETITLNLAAGNYIIEVFDALGDTNYNLDVSATPTTQPPTPITPPVVRKLLPQATPTPLTPGTNFNTSGTVSDTRSSVFATFEATESGIFTADLTGLSGDADIRLIRDYNSNRLIDEVKDRNGNVYIDKEEVEIVAWQPNQGASDESIRAFLEPGVYLLEVNSPKKETTNFNAQVAFTPAATDPLEFKVNLAFTPEAQNALSVTHTNTTQTLLETVQAAADYWSRVITHSNLNGSHTVNVKVDAQNLKPNTLANAGHDGVSYSINPSQPNVRIYDPKYTDAKNRLMPNQGSSNINILPQILQGYQQDVRFLYETMIHEFGHILGFTARSPKDLEKNGAFPISWNDRNLVDVSDESKPRYRADTFAGIAYGELLGTNQPTPLPLTPPEINAQGQIDNGGSAYAHWWTNVFGQEAQVESGSKGKPAPFSTISIASTRDLGYNVNYGAAEPYTVPKPLA